MAQLTQAERIDLKEKLQLIAEWYFTEEQPITTSCGICLALSKAFGANHYYSMMTRLLSEVFGADSDFLADYTDTYEEWESRAYMCLFLVEYLDTTIELKSSEILRKARVLMWDGFTVYDQYAEYEYEDEPNEYICDNIRTIAGDLNSTENTVCKAFAIKDKIADLIGHEFSLKDWLVINDHATWEEIYDNPEKMQQTRYNMIDDLIAYYESKGD